MKLNLRSQEFQEYSLKSARIAKCVQFSEGPQSIHGPQTVMNQDRQVVARTKVPMPNDV